MLKFLNQELTIQNEFKLGSMSETKEFSGVWNRSRIFFHTNFSTSKRQYLGMSGDSWEKPSKLFNHNYACLILAFGSQLMELIEFYQNIPHSLWNLLSSQIIKL
jgi:hypothetical protein